MKKPLLYVGLPMGSATGHDFRTIVNWANAVTRRYDRYDVVRKYCMHGMTFATLWAEALTMGAEKYLGIHTDVVPSEPFWGDVGMDILDATGAKIVSFCVAMKDNSGETSTGYARRWGDTSTTKLTRAEIARLPDPFSIRDVVPRDERNNYCLSLNNGLFVADIRGEWAEHIQWVSKAGIKVRRDSGRRVAEAYFHSEDWLESRAMAEHLEPHEILASHAVRNLHFGWLGTPSWEMNKDACRRCGGAGLVDDGYDTTACPDCRGSSAPSPENLQAAGTGAGREAAVPATPPA